MTSTTALAPRPLDIAAESGGAYDVGRDGPTDAATRLLVALDGLEAQRREVLDAYRDAHAEGAVAATRGLSMDEFVGIEGRLGRRDARRLALLTTRLPGLPVTASLLASGKLSFDQAAEIAARTAPLNGRVLREVEREAAELAADRNARGDHPDIAGDIEQLVDRHRKPRDVERRERRAIEGSSLTAQQDIDGGGLIVINADPELFETTVAATEHAAGPPIKGTPRRHQRAEGLRQVAAHWLAGTATADGTPPSDADVDATSKPAVDIGVGVEIASPVMPPVAARPTIRVIVDLADAVRSAFGQVLTSTGLAAAPHLSARLTDVLSCSADLLLQVNDGRRPLVELKDRKSIPAATRRAVLARDRRCRWPGCNAPIGWADLHHLLPRSQGGTHEPEGLVGLCRTHHVRLHGRHWHATLDPTTAAFALSRSKDGDPVHVTYPHGTHPPGVA